jgi:hypothetical protein
MVLEILAWVGATLDAHRSFMTIEATCRFQYNA